MTRILSITILSLLFLASCSNNWELQEKHLLPENVELIHTSSNTSGITTYNLYQLENFNLPDTLGFPKNGMNDESWTISKWHKPSQSEIENLKRFLKDKRIEEEWIKEFSLFDFEDVLIAQTRRSDAPSLHENDFEINDWIDLYFLKKSKKKIYHLSYGKF